MRDAGQINAQDKGLDSFGPPETSSGNNPTCCLWLGLIMIMRESPVSRLFCVSCASFKPLKIKKMTVKVSSKYTYEYEDGRDGKNKTVNISELYVMGKEAA